MSSATHHASGSEPCGGQTIGARPFLLLSHHRSGSNFTTDLIQHHPDVDIIDEPLSMHTALFPEQDLVRWPASGEGDDTDSGGAVEFLDELIEHMRRSPRPRGFKETLLFEKLDWLHARCPELVVVHLMRDPRAIAHSVLRHPMRKQWRYRTAVPRYLADSPARGIRSDLLDLASEVDLVVASWLIRRAEAERHLPLFTSTIEVQLESLVLTPTQALRRMMGALGLTPAPAQLQFLKDSQRESRGGPYSTFRTRRDILESWREGLSHSAITRIEYLVDAHGVDLQEHRSA